MAARDLLGVIFRADFMTSAQALPRVTVFSRAGCHLCERVVATVRSVQAKRALVLEVRDIEADPDLLDRYWDAIPVVLVEGREIARHRLAAEDLVTALGGEG